MIVWQVDRFKLKFSKLIDKIANDFQKRFLYLLAESDPTKNFFEVQVFNENMQDLDQLLILAFKREVQERSKRLLDRLWDRCMMDGTYYFNRRILRKPVSRKLFKQKWMERTKLLNRNKKR